MISDVTLSALANWLGSLTMVLIVVYHVRCSKVEASACADLTGHAQLINVNAKRTASPQSAAKIAGTR